jgi:hypothetical protein
MTTKTKKQTAPQPTTLAEAFVVPQAFELAGYTFHVYLKPDLQKTGAHGATYFDPGEIWLDESLEPADLRGITFFHEWFHAALHAAGRDDLSWDEGLVDLMGSFMWQFLKTAKF